jgi:hypothetical protein
MQVNNVACENRDLITRTIRVYIKMLPLVENISTFIVKINNIYNPYST